MDGIGLCAARLAALLLVFAACGIAAAQGSPGDGIDRNLLERQQQSADFHVRLYDTARAVGGDALIPLPPVPHSFVGPELYHARSPGTPGEGARVGASLDASGRPQLNDSQLRRQLGLQTQNKLFDEPTRQQQSQMQQLQFGREDQAQHLQQQIQRDSGNLMQQLH
jgi:hypothetical protein